MPHITLSWEQKFAQQQVGGSIWLSLGAEMLTEKEQFAQPKTAEAGYRFALRSKLSSVASAHWEQFAKLKDCSSGIPRWLLPLENFQD